MPVAPFIGMGCCLELLGFFRIPISQALEDYLRGRSQVVFECLGNWCWNRVSGTDSPHQRVNTLHKIVDTGSLKEIHNLLKNEETGILGICGMGGIGKTTLLDQINDYFLNMRPRLFDRVIFVDLSRLTTLESIQENIAKQLFVSPFNSKQGLNPSQDSFQSRQMIFAALCKIKFLLLLDDLREEHDLIEIGVPVNCSNPQKESKIVFTTRSTKVCNKVTKCNYEVRPLDESKSWDLFFAVLAKKTQTALNDFESLAKDVAKVCDGLPLALIVVGSAMANFSRPGEWEEALRKLRVNPGLIEDVENKVLSCLKFSYDKLPSEDHKKCLLYCALFPEGFHIEIDSLTEYWFGERFLEDKSDPSSIDSVRNSGLQVISELQGACLLEDGNRRGRNVKLHNMIRQMALWITSGSCGREEAQVLFLVNSGENVDHAPRSDRWPEATRISLMVNKIEELPQAPQCQNLATLLVNENEPLSEIRIEFFKSTPILTVLDLSHTSLSSLPPEIGSLVNLRLLDLSSTMLQKLPIETGSLKNLRQLRLNYTPYLSSLPQKAISTLSFLQSLTTFGGSYGWRLKQKDNNDRSEREICLDDLNKFNSLKEFGLTIQDMSLEDFHAFINSQRLRKMIRLLSLEKLESFPLSNFPGLLEAVKDLRVCKISKCSHLKQLPDFPNQLTKLRELTLEDLPLEIISQTGGNSFFMAPRQGSSFENLESMFILRCNKLEDITWIGQLPRLKNLHLKSCTKMVKIIAVEKVMTQRPFFPKLITMELEDMPNLKNIYSAPLLLPSLEEIRVINCQYLKKLPLGLPCESENLKTIQGVLQWWNELKWDDQNVKSWYSPYFLPVEVNNSKKFVRPPVI